jgi:hypothetical protein
VQGCFADEAVAVLDFMKEGQDRRAFIAWVVRDFLIGDGLQFRSGGEGWEYGGI